MHCQINQEFYLSNNFIILKSNKVDLEKAKEAIARINAIYDWTHDNEEIFSKLETKPDHCYFAKKQDELVGYAILRNEGEEGHLHVSWIAAAVTQGGIGSLLMKKIIRKNQKLGHRKLTLHHAINDDKVRKFYERVAIKESLSYSILQVAEKHYRVTYETP